MLCLFGLFLPVLVLNCMAGPISFTYSTEGKFVDPVGESNAAYTGLNTDHFGWGLAPLTSQPSWLGFDSITSSAMTGSAFTFGKLTFFNGITDLGTNATSVNLQLDFTLTFDLGNGTTQTIQTLMLINTPNDQTPNWDTVKFNSGPLAENVFQINGTSYKLQLFELSGGDVKSVQDPITHEWVNVLPALEDASAFGYLRANVTQVPEPSTLLLLGLGLLAVMLLSRYVGKLA
jgi:hypothetical protein